MMFEAFPDVKKLEDMERTYRLKDSFGRLINNLRISVTDRCNFRCRYCMPEKGMIWMNREELLTYEEIERIAKIFVQLGINKIRLTGGEPLLRKDLHLLIKMLSAIPELEDLALTTNGYFLADQAEGIFNAGLHRINVSLDSLDQDKFSLMTRRNYYNRVWKGLEKVEAFGDRLIKINVVLIRGINDDEILNFARLARMRSFIIRFIEFMPIGADDGWSIEKVVPTREVRATIENGLGLKLIPFDSGNQPADRFKFEDGIGEIGFITSVSEPFCNSCNRVRVTSDGKFRTCLFSLEETDLKMLARRGAEDEEIKQSIIDSVWNKEPGHLINRPGFVRPNRTMSQIGG